jgi:hypothetical protein
MKYRFFKTLLSRHIYFTLGFFLLTTAFGQSIWLETGFAYAEQTCGTSSCFPIYLKLGARGMVPVSEQVSLFLAPYWLGGFGLDAGAWFSFPVTLEDLEGFASYAGAGLSLTQGRFGLSLSGALSYELDRNFDLVVSYTHRPLFIPKFSQTFDLSAGLALRLE